MENGPDRSPGQSAGQDDAIQTTITSQGAGIVGGPAGAATTITGGDPAVDMAVARPRTTFPDKLMMLLERRVAPDALWWLPDVGNVKGAFAINRKVFTAKILDMTFNGNKWPSITRNFNRWGYRHVSYPNLPPHTTAYHNPLFQPNRPDLLDTMTQNKPQAKAAMKQLTDSNTRKMKQSPTGGNAASATSSAPPPAAGPSSGAGDAGKAAPAANISTPALSAASSSAVMAGQLLSSPPTSQTTLANSLILAGLPPSTPGGVSSGAAATAASASGASAAPLPPGDPSGSSKSSSSNTIFPGPGRMVSNFLIGSFERGRKKSPSSKDRSSSFPFPPNGTIIQHHHHETQQQRSLVSSSMSLPRSHPLHQDSNQAQITTGTSSHQDGIGKNASSSAANTNPTGSGTFDLFPNHQLQDVLPPNMTLDSQAMLQSILDPQHQQQEAGGGRRGSDTSLFPMFGGTHPQQLVSGHQSNNAGGMQSSQPHAGDSNGAAFQEVLDQFKRQEALLALQPSSQPPLPGLPQQTTATTAATSATTMPHQLLGLQDQNLQQFFQVQMQQQQQPSQSQQISSSQLEPNSNPSSLGDFPLPQQQVNPFQSLEELKEAPSSNTLQQQQQLELLVNGRAARNSELQLQGLSSNNCFVDQQQQQLLQQQQALSVSNIQAGMTMPRMVVGGGFNSNTKTTTLNRGPAAAASGEDMGQSLSSLQQQEALINELIQRQVQQQEQN